MFSMFKQITASVTFIFGVKKIKPNWHFFLNSVMTGLTFADRQIVISTLYVNTNMVQKCGRLMIEGRLIAVSAQGRV